MKGIVLFVNIAGFPIGPGLRCSEILSVHVVRRFTSIIHRRQLNSRGSDSDVHHRSLTLNRSWRPIGNFRCLQRAVFETAWIVFEQDRTLTCVLA